MKKLLVLGVVLLAVVSLIYFGIRRALDKPLFKAQCSFALIDTPIGTNSIGGLVWPADKVQDGSFRDMRIVVGDSLGTFLVGGSQYESLRDEYVRMKKPQGALGFSISNAFRSASYQIEPNSANCFSLVVKADLKEVAVEVNGYILKRFMQFIEEENSARESKTLAKLRHDIKKKKAKNENVLGLVKELDRARKTLGTGRHTVVVVTWPKIVM